MANTLGTFLVTGHIPLVCIQIGWQAQKFCHCGLLLQWFGHCGLPLMAAPHCLWQLVVHLHSSGGQSPGRTAPMVGCKAGTFGIPGFVQIQKGSATFSGALLDPPLVIFMAHGPQQDGQVYHWWWSWLEPPGGSAVLVDLQPAFIGSHGFSTWRCVGTTWLVLETAATKKQIVVGWFGQNNWVAVQGKHIWICHKLAMDTGCHKLAMAAI